MSRSPLPVLLLVLVVAVVTGAPAAPARAVDAERACAKLATKRYALHDIRVRDGTCGDARDLAVAYAAFAGDEPSMRRTGRSNVNGYDCRARRLRRDPLRLRVACSPAPPASESVRVPDGHIRFLVLER